MAEDFDFEDSLPEDSQNRTFIIVAAILGALIVLSMVFLAVFYFVLQPAQREARDRLPTEIALTNTAEAFRQTQAAESAQATGTAEAVAAIDTPFPTSTSTPTATQVVALPTDTPVPTTDPADLTATADAAAATSVPTPTATALPSTGFGEDVGLPGLAGLAVALLVLIFFSRRLRARTAG